MRRFAPCFTALLVATLGLTACPGGDDDEPLVPVITGDLVGKVTVNGQGTAAPVQLSGVTTSATADAAGDYEFRGLTPGAYQVTATPANATCPTVNTTVIRNQTVTANIPCTALATIVVTVTSSGSPVQGATVNLTGPTPGTGTTAANGTVTFTGRQPGAYNVSAQATGLLCGTGTANPGAGGTASVPITCAPPTGTISVIVRNGATGSTIAGAIVTLSGQTPGSGPTDGNGRVIFSNLVPGTYGISTTVSGFTCPSTSGSVGPGATLSLFVDCTPAP